MAVTENFLAELRAKGGVLSVAILKEIMVDGAEKTATFGITVNRAYTQADVDAARSVCSGYVAEPLRAEVDFTKLSPDEEMLKEEIFHTMQRLFPASVATLRLEDIAVQCKDDDIFYSVRVSESEARALPAERLQALSTELQKTYCGNFYGKTEIVEKAAVQFDLSVREDEAETEQFIPCRYFAIEDYQAIDSAKKLQSAMYIADCASNMREVVLCGRIQWIQEKLTKKEKPYFRFAIHDGTASVTATYFSKQKTLEKIRSLRQGDWIVVSGGFKEEFSRPDLTVNKIDRGRQAEDFVPEEKESLPVPSAYRTVFPKAFEDVFDRDFFSDESIPECLLGKEFVVFDLETTGLNNNPVTGVMDSIIEIGAVKIKDGHMTEKFSTFVKAPKPLSAEIVELTGITDEMLVGAPEYRAVLPDFFKFADGCVLVGHNVRFDYAFVSYYLSVMNYHLPRNLMDTLSLAQEQLRLSNYKLNTVAEHFKVEFRHHRAFDDALATAKCFVKLIRMRGSLPDTL